MRIDAYNQIAQLYGVQNTSKVQKTNTVRPMGKDQFQISQTASDYQVAKKAVSEASDIREDKVAQLKAKVASGEYKVETGDFASKLLEKYNATLM